MVSPPPPYATGAARLRCLRKKLSTMAGLRLILAVVLSLSVVARGHWPTPNRWLSIRGGDGFGLNNLFGDKSKEPADSSLPDIDSLFGEGGGTSRCAAPGKWGVWSSWVVRPPGGPACAGGSRWRSSFGVEVRR